MDRMWLLVAVWILACVPVALVFGLLVRRLTRPHADERTVADPDRPGAADVAALDGADRPPVPERAVPPPAIPSARPLPADETPCPPGQPSCHPVEGRNRWSGARGARRPGRR